MKNELLKIGLFTQVSDTYDLNSIYRPIQWRAADVLTDERKKVIRNRYISLAIGIFICFAVVGMLNFISGLEPRSAIPSISSPAQSVRIGNEAFERRSYEQAQKAYQQAIQSGMNGLEIWQQYDRALMMKMIHRIESNPGLLTPENSLRNEETIQPGGDQPRLEQNPTKGNEWMNPKEWQEMKQQTYEWLGC